MMTDRVAANMQSLHVQKEEGEGKGAEALAAIKRRSSQLMPGETEEQRIVRLAQVANEGPRWDDNIVSNTSKQLLSALV